MKPAARREVLVDMPTLARPFTSSGEKPRPSCVSRSAGADCEDASSSTLM